MSRPLVALTGASSFTGVWIAKELKSRGRPVLAQCSRPYEAYDGLRKLRVDLLRDAAEVRFGLDAGAMPDWIEETRPRIWIHHHHFMERFRAPDYDTRRAEEVGLKPLEAIVEALAASGCQGVIYSGSFFEPGEGALAPEADAKRTPYALSKHQVWERLRELTAKHGLPLSKVVIPNPIGPFENEDRLIPILIEKAKAGGAISLHSPKASMDNLPVSNLAESYARLAEMLLEGKPAILRPSGWVGPIEEWVRIVNEELIHQRLGLKPCRVELPAEPASTLAHSNPTSERVPIDWPRVWDEYAHELKSTGYFK